MRTLMINQPQKLLIARALEIARQHPRPSSSPLGIHPAGNLLLKDQPNGPNPQLPIALPVGFLVAVAFEQRPRGLYAHLSISIDAEDKLPHPCAVSFIAKEFGLTGELPPVAGGLWVDEFGSRLAVNVLEPVGSTST